MYFFGSPFVSKNIFYKKEKPKHTDKSSQNMVLIFKRQHASRLLTCDMLYNALRAAGYYYTVLLDTNIMHNFYCHQLCSLLTFIMLTRTNVVHLMFIRNSLLSICKIEKISYYISFVLYNGIKLCAQVYSHKCKCWTNSNTNEDVYIIYTISRALQIFNNVQDCLALQSYIC